MTPTTRIKIRPLTVALALLGMVFVAVAILYFTKTATDLPSFLPGHQAGVTRHHTKHGIAMLGLAAISWIAAWFTTAPARTPN